MEEVDVGGERTWGNLMGSVMSIRKIAGDTSHFAGKLPGEERGLMSV